MHEEEPEYDEYFPAGQLIHDIAIQKIPVTICIDRAGIVGNDGETHHGIFDMSFASAIPNLVVMAPKDFEELKQMLEFGVNFDRPVLIRYPRGGESSHIFISHPQIELGKGEITRDIKSSNQKNVTIFSIGKMVGKAMEVANALEKQNINAKVINMRFLKPIDKELILKTVKETSLVVTMEDGILNGGLYTNVLDVLNRAKNRKINVLPIGYDDQFIAHGSTDELEEYVKTDVKSIVDLITEKIKNL